MRPFTKPLPSTATNYEPLLLRTDAFKLHSGCVSLQPGTSGEEHSTEKYEEQLVVLSGTGELAISGSDPLPLVAPAMAYVPPRTLHYVRNTGSVPLQYVYTVTVVE